MNEGLVKLKIIACKDSKYEEETNDVFEALFNPEEFTVNFGVEYTKSQPSGTSGAKIKFVKINPKIFTQDFIFDGTGVATNDRALGSSLIASAQPLSVEEQIEQFRKVTLAYDGEIHSPRYLKIIWGEVLFKGRLTDLKITYTLFKPDAIPLRAKASATFKESIDDTSRTAQENASSPDLTHVRTVHSGDTLPLMSYRIYGDPSYYLEVARVNKMTHFRKLNPGDKIFFPPIDQTAQ